MLKVNIESFFNYVKQYYWFSSDCVFNIPVLFYLYLQPFGINDTIGCYLDLDNGSIKFSKNGKPHTYSVRQINVKLQVLFGGHSW